MQAPSKSTPSINIWAFPRRKKSQKTPVKILPPPLLRCYKKKHINPVKHSKKKRAPMPRRKSSRSRPTRRENSDGELTAEHEKPAPEPMKERVESSENMTAKRTCSPESVVERKKPRRTTPSADASGEEVTSTDSQTRPVCNFYNMSDNERQAAASENRVSETSQTGTTPLVETARVSITPGSATPESVTEAVPVTELSEAELLRLKLAEESSIKLKMAELKLRGVKLSLESRPNSSAPEPEPEQPPESRSSVELDEQVELNELQRDAELLSEFLAAFESIKSGSVAWLQRVMNEYIGYKDKLQDMKQ